MTCFLRNVNLEGGWAEGERMEERDVAERLKYRNHM